MHGLNKLIETNFQSGFRKTLELIKIMFRSKEKSLLKALMELLNNENTTHTYDTRNKDIPNVPLHSASV